MSILISGSLVYDQIMVFPDKFKNHIMPNNIHILNVAFTVEKVIKSLGGTAGNIAYSMKMMGAEPVIISSVGSDGEKYLNNLKNQGIKVDYISKDNEKFTASCYITTDLDDNQITAFYNGALGSVGGVESLMGSSTPKIGLTIIAPTQKDVMVKHLKECSSGGMKIMFDPGQQITALNDEELRFCIEKSHFLIGNDYEIKLIEKRLGQSGADILSKIDVLITTHGENGSVVNIRGEGPIIVQACQPEKVVDPTGAGDAWRAGFLTGCEKGFDLQICGQMGSVAASFAVEKYGTQEHKFSLEEFAVRYKKTFGEEISL
jgi:adenosine kinase